MITQLRTTSLWHGPGGTLTVAACATGGRMVVAEEHHSEDRLGPPSLPR